VIWPTSAVFGLRPADGGADVAFPLGDRCYLAGSSRAARGGALPRNGTP